MTNIEKYNQIFAETLNLGLDEVKDAKFKETPLWDSVGHTTLVAALEEAFDVLLEAEDLMAIRNYQGGIDILSKNYEIEF